MIYPQLFAQTGDRMVRAGLIGTGTFGLSLMTQVPFIHRLEIPVLCDRNIDALRRACRQAGIPEEALSCCSSRTAILQAMEKKKWVITPEAELLMDLPLDVIVEGTGDPEAGARNAEMAINHGKHVAMVNKETDSVIGAILHHRAKRSSLVYTPVDGDQHGLLMGLAGWASTLGLDIVCGGKSHAHEFVYDANTRTISDGFSDVTLTEREMTCFREIASDDVAGVLKARRELLRDLSPIAVADLCESVITANATGLRPDIPELHGPIVRTTEIPEVFCPDTDGGILRQRGCIDVVTCLRRADEAGLAGGVFIVVACGHNDAWKFLNRKGILVNRQGNHGLIYRPYHLLGVETPISILCAGVLNLSTGSTVVKPRVDLAARTLENLQSGAVFDCSEGDTALSFDPLILSASLPDPDNPVPLYMAAGNSLKNDVPAGTVLTYDMIEPPAESRLWALRREQDQIFQKG